MVIEPLPIFWAQRAHEDRLKQIDFLAKYDVPAAIRIGHARQRNRFSAKKSRHFKDGAGVWCSRIACPKHAIHSCLSRKRTGCTHLAPSPQSPTMAYVEDVGKAASQNDRSTLPRRVLQEIL